jgi:signal transduction histidine kinase
VTFASTQLANASQRRRLVVTLACIAVVLVLTSIVGLRRSLKVQSRSETIVSNTLQSVELVSRIARDIDDERLILDGHIFEKRQQRMAEGEAQLNQVKADLAQARAAYDAIAKPADEELAWKRLDADIVALDRPMARTLTLSRGNLDADARKIMLELEGLYATIDGHARTLIAINHEKAHRSLSQIRRLERSSNIFLVSLMIIGFALTGFGAWTTRLVLRREDEILRYSTALEQRNRELDAFAGRVAHDLRGPLTAVSLAAARLSERAPQEEGTSAVFQRAVTRMETLIRDLLTLSRIDAQLRSAICEVAEVARQVEEELQPRAASEGVTLHVTVDAARVRSSEGLLRQALWNLADNAVKYRRRDVASRVEIHGRVTGRLYELRVSDNGMGMSLDDAHQSFDPFYRGLATRNIPGTGLGLSIVRRVVEASGGTVAVDSQLGRGTTFVLCIPLEGSVEHPR